MNLVQLSLYEVLGYIFPGATGMAGCYFFLWTFLLPSDQNLTTLSTGGWIVLLAAAYIFGHFIQAIANSVYSRNRWRPENTIDSVIPAEIRAVLNDAACSVAGLDRTQQLSGPLIYDIADHFVLQHGKVAERDVYVYREGFYRGMTVGLLLLAVGCFCRMVAPASLQVLGVVITIAAWPLFWIGLAALSVLALFVKRYFRFANYRVKYALYSFLALETRKGEAVE